MNLYLSPAATTNLLRIGTVESAAFLGAVISVSATGAISNFSHSVISIYASKAVNKNGSVNNENFSVYIIHHSYYLFVCYYYTQIYFKRYTINCFSIYNFVFG